MVLLAMISSLSKSSWDTQLHLRVITITTLQIVVMEFTAHSYTQLIVNLGKALPVINICFPHSICVLTREESRLWKCLLKLSQLGKTAQLEGAEGLPP